MVAKLRNLFGIALILIFCIPAALGECAGLQASSSGEPTQVPSPQTDNRLSKSLTLHIFSETLEDVFKQVASLTQVSFSVSPDLAHRYVFIQGEELPLYRWMQGIAWANRAAWRVEKQGEVAGYRLYLPAEQQARQAIALADAKRFAEWAEQAPRDLLQKAMEQEMRTKPNSICSQFLARLSSGQREALASLGCTSLPMIVAGSDSFLYNRIYAATPLSALPTSLQDDLMRAANSLTDVPLNQCKFGLLAISGGVNVCAITPNGKVVNLPGGVHRTGILGLDTDDDTDPEVNQVVGQATVELEEGLPPKLKKPTLSFPSSIPHNYLPADLLYIYYKSGLPIICDDFVASHRCNFPYMLAPSYSYTLYQALTEIARAMGHQFLYFQGMMVGRTVTLGRDLRDEPPHSLVQRMCQWKLKKMPLTLEDLKGLGGLSDAQWHYLWDERVAQILQDWQKKVGDSLKNPQNGGVSNGMVEGPTWDKDTLRLLNSLSKEQLQRALSPQGLPRKELSENLQARMELAGNKGIVLRNTKQEGTHLREGIYIKTELWPNGSLHMLKVLLVVHSPFYRETVKTIEANATPTGGYTGELY